MIFLRPSVLASLMIAGISGALLFSVAQNVQQAEDKLESIQRDIHNEKETIRFLEAEWAYLNQPANLEEQINLLQNSNIASRTQLTTTETLSSLPEKHDIAPPSRKPRYRASTPLAETKSQPARPVPIAKKETSSFDSILNRLTQEGGNT